MANIPDIYKEVTGKFQKWYRENTGITWNSSRRKAADIVEASDLDYVILRITWLYNEEGNPRLHITKKGEPLGNLSGGGAIFYGSVWQIK